MRGSGGGVEGAYVMQRAVKARIGFYKWSCQSQFCCHCVVFACVKSQAGASGESQKQKAFT